MRDAQSRGQRINPLVGGLEGGLRIGLLAKSDETGKRYMQLRNAIGPQRPFTYEMPAGGVAAN